MINFLPYFLAAAFALVINSIITPILLIIAHRYSWYDEVNNRKIHVGEIPRIGGIGIAFSFFLVLVVYFIINRIHSLTSGYFQSLFDFWALFTGAVIINLLGLLDDFTNLRARYKIIIQLGAALLVVLSGRYFVSFYIPFLDVTVQLNLIAKIFTVLWIIGITNAVNLIDGMDGLSGGITAIILFFMGLIAIHIGNHTQAFILFILFGAVTSFMFFNFPPAKLFMGDSGSLFLGFFLACMPLYSSINGSTGSGYIGNASSGFALLLASSLLIVPVLDTVTAIIRRTRRGISFYSPDNKHLHHKLLKLGFSTKQILAILYSATLLPAIAAFLFILTRNLFFIYAIIVLWAVMIILVLKLSRAVRE